MANNNKYNLKLGHWNANGLVEKWSELKNFIVKHNVDVMLVNETKLSKNKLSAVPGYTIIRQDRLGTTVGGGLVIVVKNTINYQEINEVKLNSIETLGIKINNINIYTVYIRPTINNKLNKIDKLELAQLINSNRSVILVGDFNAKHTTWNCKSNNFNGKVVYEFANQNNLSIIAPDNFTLYPTNGGLPSTVDFAILKNIQYSNTVNALNELDSDHLPITIEFEKRQKITNDRIPRLDYKKADWTKFRQLINTELSINSELKTTIDIDQAASNITNMIKKAINYAIPTIQSDTKYKPLPDDILKLIKQRNNFRRAYQRTGRASFKTLMSNYSRDIKKAIKEHNNKTWDKKLEKLTVKNNTLWQTAKSFTKKSNTSIPTLHSKQGLVFSNIEKANTLADHFETVHHITEDMGDEETEEKASNAYEILFQTPTDVNEITLTSPREIAKAIQKTKPRKAPGPDGIQNIALKNLPKKAIVQLTYIYNSCLKKSYFPASWKTAHVLAFQKPGKDKLFPQSYRPISLLPTISKIFEIIILNRIKTFEKTKNLLIDEQFGFRERRSTVHQLVRITAYITNNFNINKSTAMTLLDIEKAFDTVWHLGLILVMSDLDFPRYIIKLIYNYLTNRYFKVVINGITSKKHLIVAGVPQGSILGPTLFLYYINNIPKDLRVQLGLFADDTALLTASWSKRLATDIVQKQLDRIVDYFNKWKIKINASKTELIIFSKKADNLKRKKLKDVNLNIKINNVTIKPKNYVKYLGAMLDKKLTFAQHIKYACENANKIKGILLPLLCRNSKLSVKNKLILYKSMIKPILLYAAPVWSSTCQTNINRIKTIENKTLRMISNAAPRTSNTKLHSQLQIDDIYNDIYKQTKLFYDQRTNHLSLLKNLLYNKVTDVPFTIKHKLPNSALLKDN